MDRKPTRPQQPRQAATREERQKAALRANLQKRKAQARARDAGMDDPAHDDKKES
jgi:hypothetical protein